MSIPPEFKYANEDEFTRNFLIPLLQRLGFSLVVNYHGQLEFGKDLIFAELDRFGHIRYHGLQAKYESSISLNGIEDVIRDCKQAFSNTFTHPQTGAVERISSFYAVNAGSISQEAKQHYFNSLVASYGGNVRLLEGKDLLTLDRWVSIGRSDSAKATINGLLNEINFNGIVVSLWATKLQQSSDGANNSLPLVPLRTMASSAYLMQPTLREFVITNDVLQYSILAEICNKAFERITQNTPDVSGQKQLQSDCLFKLDELKRSSTSIESALKKSLEMIGPLAVL